MSQKKNDISEFSKAVSILEHINTKIIYKNTPYLFLIKVNEPDNELQQNPEKTINFCISDGINRMWLEDFNCEAMKDFQKKIGIEGSFQNFFQMIKKAFDDQSVEIKIDAAKQLNLVINFIIENTSLQITGRLPLGIPMERKVNQKNSVKKEETQIQEQNQWKDIFAQLMRQFMFDIYQAQCAKNKNNQDELKKYKTINKELNNQIATLKENENILKLTNNNLVQLNDGNEKIIKKRIPPEAKNILFPNKKKTKIRGAYLM
ncbi:hypothetical protein PPERSA_01045 [Pseudocohnilembus persalinus]|uniref:Uncharacterized protein n=1 Tax=Pseudocohnilembus persalinus TaxID=266149 RepID=A0A0V0QUI4_PSEPJ|nr:hypothetical protein PPERSA_01045 [Pseudocohnilembus persalinus]|eukprot:KRX05967.1 hypothetical protein PPERSA_01045 [Pseudocohnilembus persalinus]